VRGAAVRRRRLVRPALGTLALSAGVLAAGCGEGLTARVERAMDACLAVRNPAFVRGEGEAAVARPLPDSILALGDRTARRQEDRWDSRPPLRLYLGHPVVWCGGVWCVVCGMWCVVWCVAGVCG
jgi:hypothetical protein